MIKAARALTGWLQMQTGPRNFVELTTHLDLDEEVFASLEYVSEIPIVGINFLRSLGVQRPRSRFYLFQALIRQGKTFYQTANKLHFRAAALMYYYAFLNFVKAYISLHDPGFVSAPVGHGLSLRKFSPRPFKDQAIFIDNRRGIFHRFYELQRPNVNINNLRLNIPLLLGYCMDVAHEYNRAGFGNYRILRTKVRLFSHQASRISWPVIAVADFPSLRPFKKSLKPFYDYFEEITIEQRIFRETFEFTQTMANVFTFFQSIPTYAWDANGGVDIVAIRKDIQTAIDVLYESPIDNDGFDFGLVLPLRKNKQISINQALAIYALMFYIGSLVRYRPEYLEKLLNSKEAWIIERFVRGAPITFLLYIGNVILGTDYLYNKR